MLLDAADKQHPVWLKLKAYLMEQLELARKANDQSLSVERTAELRGTIKFIKALLAEDAEPIEFKEVGPVEY